MLDKVGANSNPNDNANHNVDSIALFNPQPKKSFLDKIGLRTKAVLFATAISTIPVLSVGAVLYSFINQSRRQEIEIAHSNQANQITTNIKNSLKEQLRELEYLPNPDLINSRRFQDQQEILNNWQEANKINSINSQLFIVDYNGNIIADVQNKLTQNQKQENYFQTVLKTNKTFISQPLSNSNNQYYLDLAVPVKDKNTNQILYIVRSTVPVSYFQNFLTATQDKYYITDASGRIFLSNNKNSLGNNAQELSTEKLLLTNVSWPSDPELGNLKWKTLLTTDKAIAFATVNQLLWKLVIATIATTLLAGGIAAILGHRMLLRIINANYTLKKLGRGNLQTRMSLQGTDELTSLGVNINDMAQKLEELQQQQKQETQQLRLFTNTLISIRQPSSTDSLLNTTVTKIRQVFNADRAAIYRYGLQNDSQVLAESLAPGLLSIYDDIITTQYINLEPIDDLKNNQAPVISNIYEANFNSEHLYLLEQLQVKSKLTVPIFKDSVFFGYLIVHHCSKQHIWQPQEVSFLTQLAQQFGLSLERIRLLEDSQSLKNLAVHLANSWKAHDIYNVAVQDVRQALKADRTVLYKFGENGHGVFLAESVIAGFTCAMGMQLVEPCLGKCVDKLTKGKIQVINNVYQAGLNDCYLQLLESFNVKANLVVPIIVNNNLLGLLITHQCSHPRNWQQSEIDLCEQSARLIGLALERADLFSTTQQARASAEHLFEQQQQQKQHHLTQLMFLLEQIEGAVVTPTEVIQHLSEIEDNQTHYISKIATTTNTRNEIKTVAKSARLAAQAASTTTSLVENMNSIIDTNIENISNLQNTIDETVSKIRNLGDDSQEIASLTILINQIATQTNLLAINAGIEAARTSDNRQGFGMVAEEVAALANKCTAVSNQIMKIAHRLQSETTEVVTTVESQSQQVTENTNSLIAAKANLSEITDKCGQIETNVNSIYGATASQIQASKQVATALKNLSKLDTNEYSQLLNSHSQAVALIKRMKQSLEMYQVGENNG
ncbi:methyl-accepting chemotaxis sensory transducer with GAF sensor [Rivularia sp. IAM M-261]|nr:methyl-accepting chemotaxis sensory transducer with GAF sensor [Rivularia sp. IAM M-261]